MGSSDVLTHAVSGHCDERFARVREEFERNFLERGESGASVCVIVDGEPVVNLWGGVADPATGAPWREDTMNVIWSCSKGVTAICGNMAIDRGLLDPDAPVAQYWPEFGQMGKEQIPVRMVFGHQSGVFHVSGQVPPEGYNDWAAMIRLIEETEPYWVPGTTAGYHGLTMGWLVGELVRRVTGKSIGTFLREEVTEPLGGLDCWLGLPEEHEHRVARTQTLDWENVDLPPHMLEAILDPKALGNQFVVNSGGWQTDGFDTREAHAAEIPAGGGIANARGLAGVYAPLSLDGSINGVRLVREEALARMRYPQSVVDVDAVMGIRSSYTMGFSKSWSNPNLPPGSSVIIGEDAFGTPGLGGQMGFADPACRLAFGYTMTKHGMGTGLNERGQSLIDAVYEILGSPGREPGFWIRPAR